jgi:nucleoside-diphosphate-sugar epimerase
MKYSAEYWDDVARVRDAIPGIEELYGKSILITGAAGMICSSVVDVLLSLNRDRGAGIRILAAGRSLERTEERFGGFSGADGLTFVHYDATQEACPDVDGSGESGGSGDSGDSGGSVPVDYIIHGASNANPAIFMKEPVETILANVVGLKGMLDLARVRSARRLLYVSSSEVYGQKESPEPYSESDYGYLDILSTRAGYPSSKRTGESLCVAYGMEYGVETVIVRPGHIYGPTIHDRDNRASAEFTRKAVRGEDIVMKSKGDQIRSYCYTLDCASAVLTVLTRGAAGEAYNISNPHSVCTIRDIAEAIAAAAHVKVRYEIPTEQEKSSYSPMNNSSLTSGKLEALGWQPMFPLADGVRAMIGLLKG